MKIYFRQSDDSSLFLSSLGVRRCYVKQLLSVRDAGNVLRRIHHHDGFEIHMLLEGQETYEISGDTFTLSKGNYLLIPPRMAHRCAHTGENTRKCSITFSLEDGASHALFAFFRHCICSSIPPAVLDSLDFICSEAGKDYSLSPHLIENRTAEILISLARACGYQPPASPAETSQSDPRLSMAKQYISDNIFRPLGCDEVSAYCHLCTRQLSRLFSSEEGKTLTAYIHQQRIACIEHLLSDSSLTLRQISEKMHFSSEYYFNAFFKKHAGMTPGSYRKMILPSDAQSAANP